MLTARISYQAQCGKCLSWVNVPSYQSVVNIKGIPASEGRDRLEVTCWCGHTFGPAQDGRLSPVRFGMTTDPEPERPIAPAVPARKPWWTRWKLGS